MFSNFAVPISKLRCFPTQKHRCLARDGELGNLIVIFKIVEMKKYLFLLLAVVIACTYVACSDDNDPVVASLISIHHNGVEVQDNEVLLYDAEENVFGEILAGSDNEPTFVAKSPCKLEVTVTVPEHELDNFQWCGITEVCSFYNEPGTYTRVVEKLVSKTGMGMHVYFKPGVYTTCLMKVDVKVNGKAERTFFLRYNYADKKQQPK